MSFADATTESEMIESSRDVFRSYVPESDAWASPNIFEVLSIVMGGLAWTALNEARNGIDARLNPQTAAGENLDLIAGQPPLNLVRLGETNGVGFVDVNIPALGFVPAGYVFTSEAGVIFTANADTPLTAGEGQVAVTSSVAGAGNDSLVGQPLNIADTGTATSAGIFGSSAAECDDQFRQRIYAAQRSFNFFGSACSMVDATLGFPGVTRAWAVEDGGVAKILFLMEDTYPQGTPLQADIDALTAYFNDACLTNMFFCPYFGAAQTLGISVNVNFSGTIPTACDVETALNAWLRANYNVGQGVDHCDIQEFLAGAFPDGNPVLDSCCQSFPAVCDGVYNYSEVIGLC